ncbi:MAG: YraN family protein [Bauldia sp.]|nr:YraN family protein [Bauldia sp.]
MAARPFPPDPSRQGAERYGRGAERWAELYLRLKGYRILARRFRVPVGEIDLIVRRGRVIAFVEVKARASVDSGLYAISPGAQRRISRAADLWLARHPDARAFDIRFDAIVIMRGRLPHHLMRAFDGVV